MEPPKIGTVKASTYLPMNAAENCKAAQRDCKFPGTKWFRKGSILAGLQAKIGQDHLRSSATVGRLQSHPTPICSPMLLRFAVYPSAPVALVHRYVSTPILYPLPLLSISSAGLWQLRTTLISHPACTLGLSQRCLLLCECKAYGRSVT